MKMADMIELGRGVQARYGGLNQLEEIASIEIALGAEPLVMSLDSRLVAVVADRDRPGSGQHGRLDCVRCSRPAGGSGAPNSPLEVERRAQD